MRLWAEQFTKKKRKRKPVVQQPKKKSRPRRQGNGTICNRWAKFFLLERANSYIFSCGTHRRTYEVDFNVFPLEEFGFWSRLPSREIIKLGNLMYRVMFDAEEAEDNGMNLT